VARQKWSVMHSLPLHCKFENVGFIFLRPDSWLDFGFRSMIPIVIPLVLNQGFA